MGRPQMYDTKQYTAMPSSRLPGRRRVGNASNMTVVIDSTPTNYNHKSLYVMTSHWIEQRWRHNCVT